MIRSFSSWALVLSVLASTGSTTGSAAEPNRSVPACTKWSTIELSFQGPYAEARGNPNPFSIRVDVTFTSPSGREMVVPSFFDGDGVGHENGRVWKTRFSADEIGEWRWTSASTEPQLDGVDGRFQVLPASAAASGFWKLGRLEHPGTAHDEVRYLKFRDGGYWLKAGCDDPENLLGNYANFDSLAKRIAAVNYLAELGINSLYIMTHNLDGDDNDVWPWIGDSSDEAKTHSAADARFDISKLNHWRQLFEHMQTRGVVPYLILEDDSAWKSYDHDRYFREMIARFGDLPALVFNLGEEHNENYSLDEGLALARRFKELDPYDHPLGIHNINRAHDRYVDSPFLDLTAIQTGQPGTRSSVKDAVEHNQIAIDWIARCQSRGRRCLVVNFDEGRPEHDRRAWWSAYVGGGVWEAHVREPYDQPHSAWQTTWTQLGGARAFMESLPFHRMRPENGVIASGKAFCLAEVGQVYALYLPAGGAIEVDLPQGEYTCAWWNPENGVKGQFEREVVVRGGRRSFTSPTVRDWSLRIIRRANEKPSSDQTYFPRPDHEGGWRRLDSAEEVWRTGKMDPVKLDQAFEFMKGSTKNGGLLVLKDGWLVYEKYFGLGHRDATPNLASCGKSFTSVAVGILIDQRQDLFPRGLDQRIFSPKYLPAAAFPLPDPAMAEIQLGQLLSFSAGIRGNNPSYIDGREVTIDPAGPDGWQGLVDEIALGKRDGEHRGARVTTSSLWCRPGGGYSYATASIHIASILLRHVTGDEMEAFLREHLAQPLGWGKWGFGYRNAEQVRHTPGGGGIAVRATDMLRFGYLLLQGGRWKDQQVIPQNFVLHCGRQSRFNPHFPYSLQFTVNRSGRFAELPRDAFWKAGSGGHALYVVPSHHLVVWKLGGRDSQYSPTNTGLPASPATLAQVRARNGWRQTVKMDVALRETLKMVVDAVRE